MALIDTEDQNKSGVRRSLWSRLHALLPWLCWVTVLGFGAFAVVRVFGLEHTWGIDMLMAFTPYVTVLSAFSLLLALLLRRWRAALAALVAAFALVSVMVPRMVGSPDPARGPVLRVMSTNMKIGAADPAQVVSLARGRHIDVLAIQEYTSQAQEALTAAGLGTLFPYAEMDPLGGAVGSAIYSRYPLTDGGYQPFPGGFGQAYATVHVPGAVPVLVTSVHPSAPTRPSRAKPWAQGLAKEPHRDGNGPVRILIGDFNSTVDHARLRALLDTGYEDVAVKLGDGLQPTWPYDGRGIPPVTIDHILVDPRVGISSFGTAQVARTDHKSLFGVLTLPSA